MVSNEPAVTYYAGRQLTPAEFNRQQGFRNRVLEETIPWELVQEYDYLALRTAGVSAAVLAQLQHRPELQLVTTFRRAEADLLLIYRVTRQELP